MMTADEVAVACGLQPFSDFSARLRRFADAYGCEARRTGRTTQVLCQAIACAMEGKSVLLRLSTVRLMEDAARQTRALVTRAAANLGATDYVSEWNPRNVTRFLIKFASGGFIEFTSSADRMLGRRPDCELRDHFEPSARPEKRPCLHRLERAKRCCAVCGLKLRGRKALKIPRLRERMRRADPDAWRALDLVVYETFRRIHHGGAAPAASVVGKRSLF